MDKRDSTHCSQSNSLDNSSVMENFMHDCPDLVGDMSSQMESTGFNHKRSLEVSTFEDGQINDNYYMDYPPLIPSTDSSMLNALRAHNSCETQESDIEISRIIRTKRYKTNHSNSDIAMSNNTVPKQNRTNVDYGQSSKNSDKHQESLFKQVIIIEPVANVDPESPNKDINKFFSNDLFLAREISKSILGQCSIEKTTKNFKKKMVIVHLLKVNPEKLIQIKALTKLGNWDIKCRVPVSEQYSRGVIGPIGCDTPIEEIINELKLTVDNLTSVERIYKGKEKIPTVNVKLVFDSKEIPSHIFLYHQRFKVRDFIDKPWQCFHCQGFGHNAVDCRFSPRCVICAGNHDTRSCVKKNNGNEDNIPVKCVNCNGSHTANYGGCPNIIKAKEVEKIRATNKVSYRDALAVANNRENAVAKQSISSDKYFESFKEIPQTKLKSIGCQTDSDIPSKTSSSNDMIVQLTVLIVKLLKLKDLDNTKNVENIIHEVMGISIPLTAIDDGAELNHSILSKLDTENQQTDSSESNSNSRAEYVKVKKGKKKKSKSNTNELKPNSYYSDQRKDTSSEQMIMHRKAFLKK